MPVAGRAASRHTEPHEVLTTLARCRLASDSSGCEIQAVLAVPRPHPHASLRRLCTGRPKQIKHWFGSCWR